jgi:DNA-binding MarR family transcriptional regulator
MNALTNRGQEFSELLAEVYRVNGLLLSVEEALARQAGLTGTRWQVLTVVSHGRVTVAQVSRDIGMTRQAVRETVASLGTLGMVSQRDNPHDRRARLLVLTPRGRSALRSVERRRAAWLNQVAARATLTDLRAVTGILRDVGDLLQS